MLIQALCDYYDILAEEGKLLPEEYSEVNIQYLIASTQAAASMRSLIFSAGRKLRAQKEKFRKGSFRKLQLCRAEQKNQGLTAIL